MKENQMYVSIIQILRKRCVNISFFGKKNLVSTSSNWTKVSRNANHYIAITWIHFSEAISFM